jgi:hypothetical protein
MNSGQPVGIHPLPLVFLAGLREVFQSCAQTLLDREARTPESVALAPDQPFQARELDVEWADRDGYGCPALAT